MRFLASGLILLTFLGAIVPAVNLPSELWLPLGDAPAPAAPAPFAGTPTEAPPVSPLAAAPGPVGTASLPASLGGAPTPYTRLLDRLAAPGAATPENVVAAVADYLGETGAAPQPSREPANDDGLFDVNYTVAYTAPVGDVNGDGSQDVALDLYCTYASRCKPRTPPVGVDYVNALPDGQTCAHAHRLAVVSGRNGTQLWWTRVDEPYNTSVADIRTGPQYSCTQEFVLGTVPLAQGQGILVYRFTALGYLGEVVLKHVYYALDAATGDRAWRWPAAGEADGRFIVDPATGSMDAYNLVVNPILQIPPDTGPRILEAKTQPALFLQGVGFDRTGASAPAPPGYSGGPTLLDVYRPNEWAKRIDLATGTEVWTQDTFDWRTDALLEDAKVSLVPQALFPNSPFHPSRDPTSAAAGFQSRPCYAPVCTEQPELAVAEVKAEWYWSPHACCYDVSGDGVPDLLYVTHAWSSTPTYRPEGSPRHTVTRVHLFDGATGTPLYDPIVVQDRDVEYYGCFIPNTWFSFCTLVLPETLGDITGDDRADFLLHVVHYGYDYYHNVTVHDGATGAKLWERVSRLNQYVLPLGEVDGVPGNDFALFDWFNENFWFFQTDSYSFANVTTTRVTARQGATGDVIWTATGFIAPVDLAIMFDTYRLNGLPDFDQDGVGDLALDDPLYYPDLTVVHRSQIISGRDGRPLFGYNTVGAFSFPTRAGDVTGDGVDDLAVLSGDVNDLWLTTHDGATGDALWSRRVLASRTSSYESAVVRMRMHDLGGPNASVRDILLNLHFRVTSSAGFIFTATNTPQLAAFRTRNGTSDWAVPALRGNDFALVLPGSTPLTEMYERAYARPGDVVPLDKGDVAVGASLGVVTFAVAFGLGFGAPLLRRKFL